MRTFLNVNAPLFTSHTNSTVSGFASVATFAISLPSASVIIYPLARATIENTTLIETISYPSAAETVMELPLPFVLL